MSLPNGYALLPREVRSRYCGCSPSLQRWQHGPAGLRATRGPLWAVAIPCWRNPSLTLRTYADLFDSDLDALADVLDQHRTAALQPSIANSDSETDGENVPGTLPQSA